MIDSFTGNRRIRSYNARYAAIHNRLHHKFQLSHTDIRCNLYKHMLLCSMLLGLVRHLLLHGFQQRCQLTAMLQIPQIRRIRRTDIHHKKIRIRVQRGNTLLVIEIRLLIRSCFILADVDGDRNPPAAKRRKLPSHIIGSLVIEAHSVN
ncbi:hypothetical protein D3C77_370320 [compost metagenome]